MVSSIITIVMWIIVILFNVKYVDDVKHLKTVMILELIIIIGQTICNMLYKLGL